MNQVEEYIKKNNHLSDIPSAQEIKENSLQLGDIANKLLQKIEELTLYTIEQNKKIEKQAKEIQKLKTKFKKS